jgi:ElaB/YqjD/DUF883 family membrane-anchored ribosome-binding protein
MTTNEPQGFAVPPSPIVPTVRSIESNIRNVQEILNEKDVTADLASSLNLFDERLSIFYAELAPHGNPNKIYDIATQLANIAQAIGGVLLKRRQNNPELVTLAKTLSEQGKELKDLVSSRTVPYSTKERSPSPDLKSQSTTPVASDKPVLFTKSIKKIESVADIKNIVDAQTKSFTDKVNQFKSELTSIENQHKDSLEISGKKIETLKDSLNDLTSRIDQKLVETSTLLEERMGNLKSSAEEKLKEINELYLSTEQELKQKKQQVDELVGIITGNVMAGDYAESASAEKSMANWLRYGSLACMLAIACVVGYSLYETTTAAFKWENALFRLVFSILLSVPAAYLARESAKHRQQQYTHLQTSLDLKAITPYLASLPESEQHRLKAEIATRLFATRDFSSVGTDPYPINTQEIIMALLNKLDGSNGANKADAKKAG